jgi:hypothetical protein
MGEIDSKAHTMESIAREPRWTSVDFTDQQLVQLSPDTVALIYRASGSRGREEPPYPALASSVYVKRDGDWKLALHQQSPESGPR